MDKTGITLVALPGLNGTEGLFQPLADAIPSGFNLVVISYPTHQFLTYQQLSDYVLQELRHSFSALMAIAIIKFLLKNNR